MREGVRGNRRGRAARGGDEIASAETGGSGRANDASRRGSARKEVGVRRGSANARSASSAPWTCSPPLCARSHPWRRERTERGRARRRVRSRGEIFHALTSARASGAGGRPNNLPGWDFLGRGDGTFSARSRRGPPSNDPNAERARVDLCDGVISERVDIELRRVRRRLAPQRHPSPRPMDAASVDSRFIVESPASRFLASS